MAKKAARKQTGRKEAPSADGADQQDTGPLIDSDFALIITLAILEPLQCGMRGISVATQKACLLTVLAFEGEILTSECIGIYAEKDQESARAAMQALCEAGYVTRSDDETGRAFRFELNRDAIREKCQLFPTTRQTDSDSSASRTASEARYRAIVGEAEPLAEAVA